MSCAFCHVGPESGEAAGRSGEPGVGESQLERRRAVLLVGPHLRLAGHDQRAQSFFYQALRTSLPGHARHLARLDRQHQQPADDERGVPTWARGWVSRSAGARRRSPAAGSTTSSSTTSCPPAIRWRSSSTPPATTWTPRVLKDGSDSVGALGALNRVYLNIGLFSEEWLLHFRPLIGGQDISPIKIADARKNSVYWQATEQQTPNMARFFLASTDPHYLKDAPGGPSYLTEDAATLAAGKTVFAERCARCHSSKLPPLPPDSTSRTATARTTSAAGTSTGRGRRPTSSRRRCARSCCADDFLKDNFLSTELRVPSTLLQTNICSPIATNAIAGNIWDNFSSQSYKELPSVGTVKLRASAQRRRVRLRAAGRRPRLHAAGVARQPVVARRRSCRTTRSGPFDREPVGRGAHAGVPGVDRTDALARAPRRGRRSSRARRSRARVSAGSSARPPDSYIRVPRGYLPDALRPLLGIGQRLFPFAVPRTARCPSGRFPKGTPVSLLTSMDVSAPTCRRTQRKRSTGRSWSGCSSRSRTSSSAATTRSPTGTSCETMLDDQQVPGLRHQQGPLLRHEPLRRGARPERRGQARADRVPEDDVGRSARAALRAREHRTRRRRVGTGSSSEPSGGGGPTPRPAEYDADYIVVGSGAGGGTVAARLAEAGFRVLLLEAGGDPRTSVGSTPQTPGVNSAARRLRRARRSTRSRPRTTASAGTSSSATTPIRRRQERIRSIAPTVDGKPVNGVLYPRAGTLGGCTAHNAMIFVVPAQRRLESARRSDRRSRRGAPSACAPTSSGSSAASTVPDERAASRARPQPEPPRLVRLAADREVAIPDARRSAIAICATTILESARAALRSPEVAVTDADRRARLDSQLDPNDWRVVSEDAIGLRYTPLTTKDHRRVGHARARARRRRRAARSPEDPAARARHARAVRRRQARDRRRVPERRAAVRRPPAAEQPAPGTTRQVFAAREVILAGGAFNTPQLLMLSGIGPAADARDSTASRCVVDLPGVGTEPAGSLRSGGRQPHEVRLRGSRSKGATFTRDDPQYEDWADVTRRRLRHQRRRSCRSSPGRARTRSRRTCSCTRCSAASTATSPGTRRCSRRTRTA